MRKFLKFMLAAVLISTTAASCSNDDPKNEPGTDPGVESQVIVSKAKTGEGVSITVNTTATGFTFTTEMGVDAPTYRLDVMPYAKYQNDFFEARKKNKEMTEEEFLTLKLFGTGGAAGYILNTPFDGDWFTSKFKQAVFVPGVDYIILTCGALMTDGTQVGEFNKVVVPMYKPAVVGDPKAEIMLEAGYTGVAFSFTMNSDCSGFYQLVLPTEDVEDVLKEFGAEDPAKGETMLRELVSCFMMKPMQENWEPDYLDFSVKVKPGLRVTALTVGVDKNGTLANTYLRKDVELLKDPKPMAEYTCDIVNASAVSIITEWDTDPNNNQVTRAAYHRVMTADAQYISGQDSIDLIYALADGGYGHNATSPRIDVEWDLLPHTDYVVVSTARNKATQFTPLRFQKFTTKSLVIDQPEKSLAQIKCELIKPSKTSITVKYDIPDGTTCYFERVVEKGYIDEDSGICVTDKDVTDAKLIKLLMGSLGNSAAYTANFNWAWTGLEPSKEYYYFLVAEDKNGFMGPLIRKTFTTKDNQGGPNPVSTITGLVEKQTDGTYVWNVTYTINDDVTNQLVAVIPDETPDGKTPEDMINIWTDKMIGVGGEQGVGMPSVNTTWAHPVITKYSREVALALPYGADDVQGKLAYLVFKPEMIVSNMLSVRPLHANVQQKGPQTDMSKYRKIAKN